MLYINQCTNPTQPWYKMWVVSLNGNYLHTDGVWRPLNELERKDENGKWTAYWPDGQISMG